MDATTVTRRAALGTLLGCVALLGGSLGAARAQTAPTGVEVLQAAAQAMDTVTTVHVSSVSNQSRNGLRSHWKTTGVCDAAGVTDRSPYFTWHHQLRARVWIRGWSEPAPGKRVTGSTHYLMLAGTTSPRLWIRSSATHNQWHRTSRDRLLSDVYDACSVLFPDSTGIAPEPALASYRLLGQKTVSGTPAWSVLEIEAGNDPHAVTQTDWLVGTAGSHILGSHTTVKGSTTVCSASKCSGVRFTGTGTASYSDFDQPVTFTPPTT